MRGWREAVGMAGWAAGFMETPTPPTPAGSSADDVLLIDDTEDTDEWLVSPS